MKKLILGLAVILPTFAFASDGSVYAWGPWADGIKPAAGPVYVAPAPADQPEADMRESIELLQQYNEIQYVIAPPAIPGAPQLPGIVGCAPACPSGSGGLGGGGSL